MLDCRCGPRRVEPALPVTLTILALVVGLLGYCMAESAPLRPSVTVPDFDAVNGSDYFPLLLAWTKETSVGSTHVLASFLDPRVILAEVKTESVPAAIQKERYRQQTQDYPRRLTFQLRLRTGNKSRLEKKLWSASLDVPDGARLVARAVGVVTSPHLIATDTGSEWEEVLDFTFDSVPPSVVAKSENAMGISVAGPSGTVNIQWSFQSASSGGGAQDGAGYVPLLGWVLTALVMLLVGVLFVTRPPREVVQ